MSPDNQNPERRLEERAKELFDQSVGRIDGHTRSKLAQARNRALEHANSKRGSAWWSGAASWVPAGAVAASAFAAWLLWQGVAISPQAVDLAALSDLEILLADEELEMLEELEFYAWLQEQPEFAEPATIDDSIG